MKPLQEAKYIDMLKRARVVRHWIAENPGKNYREIRAALFPMECPIMWLDRKNFIRRERHPENGTVYFAKPMEGMREFANVEPIKGEEQAVGVTSDSGDSEATIAPEEV